MLSGLFFSYRLRDGTDDSLPSKRTGSMSKKNSPAGCGAVCNKGDDLLLHHTRCRPSSESVISRLLYKSPTAFLKTFLLTPNSA